MITVDSKLLLYFIDQVKPRITKQRLDDGSHPYVCEYEIHYEYTLDGIECRTGGKKRIDLRDEGATVTEGRAGSHPLWSEERLKNLREDIVMVTEVQAGIRALKVIVEQTGWPLSKEQQAEFSLVNCAAVDLYWKTFQAHGTAGAMWLCMSVESRAIQRQRLRVYLEERLNLTISDLEEFVLSRCGRTMDAKVKSWREMETGMLIERQVNKNPRAMFFPIKDEVAAA